MIWNESLMSDRETEIKIWIFMAENESHFDVYDNNIVKRW